VKPPGRDKLGRCDRAGFNLRMGKYSTGRVWRESLCSL
jgi:hypothetical protein